MQNIIFIYSAYNNNNKLDLFACLQQLKIEIEMEYNVCKARTIEMEYNVW